MSATGSSLRRCPKCLALAEPEARWCSLCFASLASPVATTTASVSPVATAGAAVSAVAPPTAARTVRDDASEQADDEANAGRRVLADVPVDLGADVAGPLTPDVLVSLLAAEEAQRGREQLGPLASMVQDKGQRASVAFLGTVLVCGLFLVAMLLIGLLM